MSRQTRRQALGMGLKALIPDVEVEKTGESVSSIRVESIVPNPYQPRREFNPEKLKDLVDSIKEKGVVQPILVRTKGNKFELIAGERRFQAVKLAEFEEIPAIVRDADDREMLELALIENIQREDLNPIDEAMAYQQLMDEFGLTQLEVSQRVGKDRSTLANAVRLLKLPPAVQSYLSDGSLTVGHARALLSLPTPRQQEKICVRIIKKGLTVRDAEKLIRRENEDGKPKTTQSKKDAQLRRIEEQLQHQLGTKINIKKRGQKGSIQVEFYSWKDLERIIEKMGISLADLDLG